MKNIKKYLIIILVLTIWMILWIEFRIIPLIPSILGELYIDKINNIILILSYSIIAAYIFYYFTSILPRNLEIKRSKILLFKIVKFSLLNDLRLIISCILDAYNIDLKIDEVEEKHLLHIDGNIKEPHIRYWKSSKDSIRPKPPGGKIDGFRASGLKFPDAIIKKLGTLPKVVNSIKKTNPNYHYDEIFAASISSIETNKLIEWYYEKDNKLFTFQGSAEQIFQLIVDYRTLVKLNYQNNKNNKEYLYHHFYSNTEVDTTPYTITTHSKEIEPIFEKLDALNPKFLFNPLDYDARAIDSVINSGGYYSVDRGSRSTFTKIRWQKETDYTTILKETKFIVIVLSGIDKKSINKIVGRFKNKAQVLLISPSLLSNKNNHLKNKRFTENGIFKIRYKSSFKFFGNSKNPTKDEIIKVKKIIYNILEL
ncbi:MAG TPA: hypothetical protein DHV22_08685 [Xanthomarina gelatinilytica]|uniref:Uncharacterized protein n=1 Tax=Xanthomarina gelatinilytica TaxID=1137281 RepID=A0A3D6BQZ2_9FLAO|nr:hypothetical protein [Xanthomarina gelatinilytica]